MEPVILRFRKWPLCMAVVISAVFPFSCPADEPIEYQVKAAFLLNFTKFIQWPETSFETSDSPIAICVLGRDPFGSALDQLVAGESVNGRRVTIQRVQRAPSPKSCQVLFAASVEKDVLKLLPDLGPGVLTVGEGDGFLRGGGMITFVLENRRVRFEINQARAEKAGLKLSARLLNVAKAVEK
jgi:hypothetical protein